MSPSERGCSPSNMQSFAAELEAALPSGADLTKAQASALGGMISKVVKLIADLKASDWTAVITDVFSILDEFRPTTATPDVIVFKQTQAAQFKVDWSKILGIILKLLPTILGA